MAGIALSLVKVSKSYGSKPILDELSFGLLQGEKVGLIGRNGSGKTTLFRLLAGEDHPDSGEVVITHGLRIARLSQDPHFPPGCTVRTALEWALAEHQELIRLHGELLEQLHGVAADQEASLHEELERVEHHLHHMGWDLEPRMKEACTTWGLGDMEAEIEALSGGWRKRVALAQAWLKDPDVLVLDEPTNHLDPEQVERLQAWLQGFDGALLLITHDRHLLDEVVTRMLEIEEGAISSFEGGYGDYMLEKADRMFREARLTEHMQNRLRREMAWLSRGAKARTRKSKIRIDDALQLKDDVKDRTREETRQDLTFQGGESRKDALAHLDGIRFAYEAGTELVGGLDLILQRGMRLALLGPNGCGKSTLIKLILGDLQPVSGTITLANKVALSAISQGRGELDFARSIVDNLADGAPTVKIGDAVVMTHVYLTRFGFPVDHQKRIAGTLSGGERNRLLLARTMLQPSDLLVLDEPTNDLDIPTLQNLEEALMDFPGTLILVSHDRFFLEQVVTHTLAWKASGEPRWEVYEGPPSTVRSLREARAAERGPQTKAAVTSKAAVQSSPRARKPGLTQKEERRLAELERDMEALNARIADLDAALADPQAFLRADAPGHEAMRQRGQAQVELDVLETEWLEMEEKRGEAGA